MFHREGGIFFFFWVTTCPIFHTIFLFSFFTTCPIFYTIFLFLICSPYSFFDLSFFFFALKNRITTLFLLTFIMSAFWMFSELWDFIRCMSCLKILCYVPFYLFQAHLLSVTRRHTCIFFFSLSHTACLVPLAESPVRFPPVTDRWWAWVA